MVAMDVQLDEISTQRLINAAKTFPREVRRAFYYACGIALRMMRSRMSGKSDKIAKWDDFTKRYRAMALWASASAFGGKLMWPDKKKLTMEPRGDRVRVGWIGPMESAAERFQEGGSAHNSWDWRRERVKQGFSMHEVPEYSVTPRRPVIEQVEAEARRHLADWTLSALIRVLDGRIKSWEKRYDSLSTEGKRGGEIGPKGDIIRARRASALGFREAVRKWYSELNPKKVDLLPGTY